MSGDKLKISDFNDIATIPSSAPSTPQPALAVRVIFKRKRNFARVVSPTHPLYEAEVEISGIGRKGKVYAMHCGTEIEFHSDQLCDTRWEWM